MIFPLHSRDPKEFIESTDYLESVAEFGFNHIMIIGEIDYGMVFMDCYGRLFQWEDMCQRLCLSESDDGLQDDGNVYKHKPKKSHLRVLFHLIYFISDVKIKNKNCKQNFNCAFTLFAKF